MAIWIPITLMAALAQTLRFMLQKHLKSTQLSTAGATFARFIYSAPIIALIAFSYARVSGQGAPELPSRFFAFMVAGGTSQILATMCVVALFAHRNFAVGITFKKTEVLMSALIGFLLLGEFVPPLALLAIFIGLGGVLLLSDPPKATGPWRKRVMNRAVALGLTSGVLFGVSGVSYRGASLSIGADDVFYQAIVTLAFVSAFQVLVMAGYLAWREKGEILRVFSAWRVAALVGLTSMIGSICWFTAYTLQTAAYVNALGQVELFFSLMAATLFFGEKIERREWQGLALLTASVILLVIVT